MMQSPSYLKSIDDKIDVPDTLLPSLLGHVRDPLARLGLIAQLAETVSPVLPCARLTF